MRSRELPEPMRRRYARLVARLAKIGWVLQGTIHERLDRRPDPRAPSKKKTYGPYYQWTFKHNGKTITVNLSPSQARTYQKAISNHRKVKNLLKEMRALSREFLEATTKGVKKRKPRSWLNLPLS
jgi:hypothetical protein